MPKITPSQRKQAESLIISVYDKLDKTGINSEYWKGLFDSMTDDEFYKFFQRRLPLRYQLKSFKNEPTMNDIYDAFDVLGKPLLEKVKMPHLYKNKNGEPIESKECLVIYVHLKRMKQMLAKKTSVAVDIAKRDNKTGRLLAEDKGGQESDREFEALAIMGLERAMDEYARPRADSMRVKDQMYTTIMNKGFVSENDLDIEKDDSMSKNLLNVYLIGANIHSNLIDEDYMTPLTIKNKKQKIERRM
jgi:hypothetical protein